MVFKVFLFNHRILKPEKFPKGLRLFPLPVPNLSQTNDYQIIRLSFPPLSDLLQSNFYFTSIFQRKKHFFTVSLCLAFKFLIDLFMFSLSLILSQKSFHWFLKASSPILSWTFLIKESFHLYVFIAELQISGQRSLIFITFVIKVSELLIWYSSSCDITYFCGKITTCVLTLVE